MTEPERLVYDIQPSAAPQIVIPEITDADRLTQLVADNEAVIERLARMGAALNPVDILRLQLGALVEFLAGWPDDPRRIAYEIHYHTGLARILDGIESQVAQAKLMQGVPPANGHLLRPGQQ